jgi:lambda family phage minor tail protein L
MSDLFLLRNTEIIDLFEIKLGDFEGYFYFHGSKNLNRDIIFKGKNYLYIPCEISSLEYNSEGKQSRPTLTISNTNNFITNLIKDRNDLLGRNLYRKKIFAKDLDGENFGEINKNLLGSYSFTDFLHVDSFVINKKNMEDKEKVEFTLANILDIDGLTVPTRKVFNDFCAWQYRGDGCNYGRLTNYNGPTLIIGEADYDSLSDITTEFSIDTNLILWLNQDGQTFGSEQQLNNKKGDSIGGFPVLTSWLNQASTINLSIPYALPTVSIGGQPKKFINSGRYNNKQGIYFLPDSPATDSISITKTGGDFTGEDYTVFYVSEMVTKVYNPGNGYHAASRTLGGKPRDILRGDTNTFFLGYYANQLDKMWLGGNWFYNSNLSFNASLDGNVMELQNVIDTQIAGQTEQAQLSNSYFNKLRAYCGVMPSSTSSETQFYKNGYLLKSDSGYTYNSTSQFGININSDTTSECVVYEMIVFNTALTQDQIRAVFSYLSNKYKLPIESLSVRNLDKDSSAFFQGYEDGNLGVPMADENNKLFLESQQSEFFNYNSYGLNDLVYKGDYSDNVKYAKGDFVKIDPEINFDFNQEVIKKTNELPARFFVCINDNGSEGLHPLKFKSIWVEDKCSRKLSGCILRFRGEVPTPFGGFPGTVSYDYRLPNT